MVMFWPIQQELDCINSGGDILGKIRFDGSSSQFIFYPANENVRLTAIEQSSIEDKVSGLNTGRYSMPMQDDD